MAQKKQAPKKTKIEDLTPVTEKNKKFAMVLGRIFYIVNAKLTCNSPDVYHAVIYPRRIKSTYWIIPEGRIWIHEEESRSDYADHYSYLADRYMAEGKLFINVDEPLVDVRVEKKNGEVLQKSNVQRKVEPIKTPTVSQMGFED